MVIGCIQMSVEFKISNTLTEAILLWLSITNIESNKFKFLFTDYFFKKTLSERPGGGEGAFITADFEPDSENPEGKNVIELRKEF